jgi:hypothetical protein
VIIPPASAYVTAGAERRATGTRYTPPNLTEPIVWHTLEPLVYVGPAQDKARQGWTLRDLDDLLGAGQGRMRPGRPRGTILLRSST